MRTTLRGVFGLRGVCGLALGASLLLAACAAPSSPPVPSASTLSPVSPSSSQSLSSPPSPSVSPAAKPKPLPSLKGADRSAFAYAPLSNPDDIHVTGHVDSQRAWSTSKVLVILAFIKEVAGGDPDNLSPEQRRLIKLALTESDLNALLALRAGIPGGSGRPMTEILRSVGDDQTVAPDIREGAMEWTIRNQIKFLAALHAGKVVSKKASKYVLDGMHPVKSESWGLGTIGASAFKGGWLEPYTETRQMGIVDGYAVAIITNGVGPSELQIDGDYAHVKQMNKLARMLQQHLEAAQQESARVAD